MHAASIILLSWAMIGAACFFSAPAAAAAAALWYAILAGLVAVVGLPHGAADHRFARPRLEPVLGPAWLPVFLAGYLAVAIAVACGWFVAPAATIIVFFLASAWHFGLEEPRPVAGPRWLEPVLRFARGGLVIWMPLVFHTQEVTATLGVVAPADAGPAIGQAMLPLAACAWVMLAVAAAAWISQVAVAAGRTGRIRRVLLADNLLVASLALLFAVASPLVGFIVYFCAWHSARGLRRLRHRLGETWPELAGSLAAPTAGAIALIGLVAWFGREGTGWNDALVRATFGGLSAVAIPHLLLHGVASLFDSAARPRSSLRCGSAA